MNNRDLNIAHEEAIWGEIFTKEISRKIPDRFSSFWWENYYSTITLKFRELLKFSDNPKILEPGCGSGKASILLCRPEWRVTLLDISDSALKFAKYTSEIWSKRNVTFLKSDIFDMSLVDRDYDLVWNIGVIEHYKDHDIKVIVKEMLKKTKDGGFLAIGYPNFFSGPIIKAWVLKYIPMFWVDSYRLDTERFFNRRRVQTIIEDSLKDQCLRGDIQFYTVGNPLPMETPKILILTLGRVINFLFPRNRFLTFAICRVQRI